MPNTTTKRITPFKTETPIAKRTVAIAPGILIVAESTRLGQMPHQALFAVDMATMALRNSLEAVTLDGFIDGGREDSSGDIDEDGDGSIAAEGAAAVEYGSDDARAQVTGEVG